MFEQFLSDIRDCNAKIKSAQQFMLMLEGMKVSPEVYSILTETREALDELAASSTDLSNSITDFLERA